MDPQKPLGWKFWLYIGPLLVVTVVCSVCLALVMSSVSAKAETDRAKLQFIALFGIPPEAVTPGSPEAQLVEESCQQLVQKAVADGKSYDEAHKALMDPSLSQRDWLNKLSMLEARARAADAKATLALVLPNLLRQKGVLKD